MNKRTRTNDLAGVRMMDARQLQDYLQLGKNSALIFGKECGAARKIGRRLLFDRVIIDKALDALEQ